jgi:hypothetical protein
VVDADRPQMTILSMRFECWIPKATNTQSEHVILIAFPLQQWLQERAPVHRLSCFIFEACFDIIALPVLVILSLAFLQFIINSMHLSHGVTKIDITTKTLLKYQIIIINIYL